MEYENTELEATEVDVTTPSSCTSSTSTPKASTRKFRSRRRSKAKFHGIRYTNSAINSFSNYVAINTSTCSPKSPLLTSISHKKVTPILTAVKKKSLGNDDKCTGNRFMNMDILSGVFFPLSCPECKDTSSIRFQQKKEGLAFELQLNCQSCDWFTSKKRKQSRRALT